MLHVRKLTSIADYVIICGANSERQAQAIASYIKDELLEIKERLLCLEGQQSGHWILMDYGDVIVHIFLDSTREFYDLEGLWADAPRVSFVDPAADSEAAGAAGKDADAELDIGAKPEATKKSAVKKVSKKAAKKKTVKKSALKKPR